MRGPAASKADEARDVPAQALSVPDVYVYLSTRAQGLAPDETADRLARFGHNTIREVRRRPLLITFLTNFTHLMAVLLWIAGSAAFVARMPQLGLAIWMVNVINGVFSFWQEYKAEKAVEALRRLLPPHASVLRANTERQILAADLVPGDVVVLREGDRISADARVVWESELRVDQSTLTGESHPVRKTSDAVLNSRVARVELPNLVFAGTMVAAGTGRAVVYTTGMNTEFGKIAGLTQTLREEQSPLQVELRRVTRVVTVIAVALGLIFFALAVALAGIDLAEGFIFAIGMIVAFVPEGLLPTVSLALAMGVQRMARRNALIKRLSAVETLGCTTVICTDKTGTLTQNEMTVRDLWCAGQQYRLSGAGYDPEGHIQHNGARTGAEGDDPRLLLLAAGLCTNARLLPPNSESSRWNVLGDPTEAALRVAAAKAGIDLDAEARAAPRVRELAFESRRKRMATIHRTGNGRVAYVKGAPRELLARCTRIWWKNQERVLDDSTRAQVIAANDDYARAAMRVLAVAMRVIPDGVRIDSPDAVEDDLTFLGLAAMMDPPRPEVLDAVTRCHRAGIRIVMITGDYGLTAESIARRIGIIRGERPRIIGGGDLDALSEEALQDALREEVIFARVAPEHKLRVVSALQAANHVVAVTGDGVNDAPALKKAHIGIAMGVSGTDVAREAADIVLTDDNFASIVNAIEEGRAVYANIKKFTTYIFTSNTPEAVPFILFALSRARIPLALNVMHVLAIDLGTDIMPALALGVEPPEPGIMDRPPRSLKEHVITRSLLLRAYLWLGPLQAAIAMAAFYAYFWTNGHAGQWLDLPSSGPLYGAATAMALASVVATQIGNVFAQRTDRTSVFRANVFSNRMIWVGIATELILILLVVYVPLFQRVIGTAAFPPRYWLFLAAWMPSLLIVDEIRKALVRRHEGRAGGTP